MLMVNIFCPMCGINFDVEKEHIGVRIRCLNCSSTFIVEEKKVSNYKLSNKHIFENKNSKNSTKFISLIFLMAIIFPIIYFSIFESKSQTTNSNSNSNSSPKPSPTVSSHPSYPKPNNDTELIKSNRSGLGELTISNGTQKDAIAKLVVDRKAIRIVYISSHNNAKLTEIPDGEYSLFFALGDDYEPTHFSFYDAFTSEFDKKLNFQEIKEKDGTSYSTYSVTLEAVPDGNARTSSVSKNEFNELLP
ncbi:hypothetical protein HZF08_01730 [Paenibacillus sp. CGMCC 1.16610]|uniref:Zinc finger/thioredoxin putative domain-containing protein n=1 Tax=Paenibacillus anseongense TaxID=2682845 RepID=A0ABW9U2Q5_9BACL|nr:MULTISPECIES: hypothetical protein [Paenibacillus]MBA2937020.1 hypothetical protein [Paenibacillus sp. CGMCC 1.16610]MVQ33344.1 hypothetical protein [Paenibacillus anseongense]